MIRSHLPLTFVIVMMLGVTAAMSRPQDAPELPPGHPPTEPQLPPGHPTVDSGRRGAAGPANPADVESIDAIIGAYYGSISGAAGESRDWNRFRSLFIPGARFITARGAGQRVTPVVMSPDQFIELNASYFERRGYDERELNRSADSYGAIAQVFSTYASRRAATDDEPYSKGINSFQLFNDGERWWIASVMWDYERPDGELVPERYLP